MRGVLAGALALIALQVVVSAPRAGGALSSGAEWAAQLVERFLDPAVPAIGPRTSASPEPRQTIPPTSPRRGGGGGSL